MLAFRCARDELRMAEASRSEAIHRLKMDGGFEQWATPLGTYWMSTGAERDLREMVGEQSVDIYSLAKLKPGSVVLDCGANIGMVTRLALNHGAGKVIAIEPAPDSVECLRRNFAKEIASGAVIVCPKGVWDKDDILRLALPRNMPYADSFVLRQDARGISAPLTTIDRIVSDLKLDRVDMIKMDIEGAEQKALRGASDTIRRFHPRLEISGYHLPEDHLVIPRMISAYHQGYISSCTTCNLVPTEGHDELRPKVLEYF